MLAKTTCRMKSHHALIVNFLKVPFERGFETQVFIKVLMKPGCRILRIGVLYLQFGQEESLGRTENCADEWHVRASNRSLAYPRVASTKRTSKNKSPGRKESARGFLKLPRCYVLFLAASSSTFICQTFSSIYSAALLKAYCRW